MTQEHINRVWLIIFGDFIAFWASFLIILFVRFGAVSFHAAISTHVIPFAILYLLWGLSFYIFGFYDLFSIKPTISHLNRFGIALFTSFITGISLFYFIPGFGITPKTILISQVIGFGLFSLLTRRMIYLFFSRSITRPVSLVGTSSDMDKINSVISNNPQLGLQVISRTNNSLETIRIYASTENLVLVFENIPDAIPKESIITLYKNNAEIINVAQAYERYLQKIPVDHINQTWIIENISIKENIMYSIAKKIIDTVVPVLVLALTSPVTAVCSLFIFLHDRGPVVYGQERVGLNGRIFKLYKLRSMIMDSELNGAVWADRHDGRITPIGKIIRKLHIDEIPQMINILKGDISLVGPRPERPEFVTPLEGAIPHYELRHIIRPGFTGWAQIKYRYASTAEDSKEKFEYDLYYIKNKNIFLDFAIILKTIQIIFTH